MYSHPKFAPFLPDVIDEAEKHRIAGRRLYDAADRRLLLLDSRHGRPVGTAGTWPTGFQIVARQTGADGLQILELHGDEIAGGIRRHAGVEERMNVGGHDVQDGAEVGGMCLQNANWLRGRDGT